MGQGYLGQLKYAATMVMTPNQDDPRKNDVRNHGDRCITSRALKGRRIASGRRGDVASQQTPQPGLLF